MESMRSAFFCHWIGRAYLKSKSRMTRVRIQPATKPMLQPRTDKR